MIKRAARWVARELRVRRDPIGYARSLGVRVGDGCRFFGTTHATWGTEPYLIRLGDDVMVTAGVRFINHDGAVLLFRRRFPDLDLVGTIVVGDRVFLGLNSLILPGVTIGSDVVIGAGAVVNRDIPANSVAAGVPARVICTLDEWLAKHESRFVHVHRLPEPERRRALLAHVGWLDAGD